MTQYRQQIEDFVRSIVAEIEAAEAAGVTGAKAIADHLNANRVTTRKGRSWTDATVAKFRRSPGAKRYRSGGVPSQNLESHPVFNIYTPRVARNGDAGLRAEGKR